MKKMMMVMTAALALAANGQGPVVPRITWQVDLEDPRPVARELRYGETIDFDVRLRNYGFPLDIAGASVTLHAVTNGMAWDTSFQVKGAAGSNGLASVRVNVGEWVPWAFREGRYALAITQTNDSRVLRVEGPLRVLQTAAAAGIDPVPVAWADGITNGIMEAVADMIADALENVPQPDLAPYLRRDAPQATADGWNVGGTTSAACAWTLGDIGGDAGLSLNSILLNTSGVNCGGTPYAWPAGPSSRQATLYDIAAATNAIVIPPPTPPPDLSGLVPYVGATEDVILANRLVSAARFIVATPSSTTYTGGTTAGSTVFTLANQGGTSSAGFNIIYHGTAWTIYQTTGVGAWFFQANNDGGSTCLNIFREDDPATTLLTLYVQPSDPSNSSFSLTLSYIREGWTFGDNGMGVVNIPAAQTDYNGDGITTPTGTLTFPPSPGTFARTSDITAHDSDPSAHADLFAALEAGRAEYRWRFVEGFNAATVSASSRMGYWPYATLNSASTWVPWLLAPTVVYPSMDFRTWNGVSTPGVYYVIRMQVYWDQVTKATGSRTGHDTALYLTPQGCVPGLPSTSAGAFVADGMTTQVNAVDIAAALIAANGLDPALYDADIGTITWSARLLSGTSGVNPRIQFRATPPSY